PLGLLAAPFPPAARLESLRSPYFHPPRPPPISGWLGSCMTRFEAGSAFPLVPACRLAESPSHPFHRKLRQLRCLCRRFDCYRVEPTSSRAGVAPAEVHCLFTAHVIWRYFNSCTFVPCVRTDVRRSRHVSANNFNRLNRQSNAR